MTENEIAKEVVDAAYNWHYPSSQRTDGGLIAPLRLCAFA